MLRARAYSTNRTMLAVSRERARITPGEAFAMMRAQARRTQQTLTMIADAVLDGTIGISDLQPQ